MNSIIVKAEWDDEAQVWWAISSDVPGLTAEAASIELLRKKLPGMIEDLNELNNLGFDLGSVHVHIVAHSLVSLSTNQAA